MKRTAWRRAAALLTQTRLVSSLLGHRWALRTSSPTYLACGKRQMLPV